MIQSKLNDYFVLFPVPVVVIIAGGGGGRKNCNTYCVPFIFSVDRNKCHVYPCFAPLACCLRLRRHRRRRCPFARNISLE